MVDIKGFNRHKKKQYNCPDVESARRLVLHWEEVPAPQFGHVPNQSNKIMSMNC